MSETASPTGAAGKYHSSQNRYRQPHCCACQPVLCPRVKPPARRWSRWVTRQFDPLITLLDDRQDHVRWEAAKSLSEIADPAAARRW